MLNFKHLYYFYMIAKTGAVNKAAEQLFLTPQTLSGQLSAFERQLGVNLFNRQGKRLILSDAGRQAMSYASEIFQRGYELEQLLRNRGDEQALVFRVGIADVVPKSLTCELLTPVMQLRERIRIVCREDPLDVLLAELAVARLDMVLADQPLPSGMDIRGCSHRLGESGISFFAAAAISDQLQTDFPACLDGAPLLMPAVESALHSPLLRWLHQQQLYPDIMGEFDDSALMKQFGQAGLGVFPGPGVMAEAICQQYGVTELGSTEALTEAFYLITPERKRPHPASRLVLEAAMQRTFADFKV